MAASGARVTLTLPERLPEGPCILVPNHASMLDICTIAAQVPVNLRFVSRPFFFKVPVVGWGMLVGGHVALDPKKPRDAARTLATLARVFSRGISLVLFPEGTRSAGGRVGHYKRGPFLTAIRNGVPVVPVYLGGLHAVLPRGRLLPRAGPVRVVVGAPIPTAGRDEREATELARRVEAWAREREDDARVAR